MAADSARHPAGGAPLTAAACSSPSQPHNPLCASYRLRSHCLPQPRCCPPVAALGVLQGCCRCPWGTGHLPAQRGMKGAARAAAATRLVVRKSNGCSERATKQRWGDCGKWGEGQRHGTAATLGPMLPALPSCCSRGRCSAGRGSFEAARPRCPPPGALLLQRVRCCMPPPALPRPAAAAPAQRGRGPGRQPLSRGACGGGRLPLAAPPPLPLPPPPPHRPPPQSPLQQGQTTIQGSFVGMEQWPSGRKQRHHSAAQRTAQRGLLRPTWAPSAGSPQSAAGAPFSSAAFLAALLAGAGLSSAPVRSCFLASPTVGWKGVKEGGGEGGWGGGGGGHRLACRAACGACLQNKLRLVAGGRPTPPRLGPWPALLLCSSPPLPSPAATPATHLSRLLAGAARQQCGHGQQQHAHHRSQQVNGLGLEKGACLRGAKWSN